MTAGWSQWEMLGHTHPTYLHQNTSDPPQWKSTRQRAGSGFLRCNIPAVTANHTTPSYTGENMRWCPIVYYYTHIPTMHHLIHFDMQCEMSIHANTNKSERIQRHVRSSAIIKTRNLNCNLCDNQSTDWSAVFNLRVETHKGLVRWIQGVTWRPPGLGHYYGLNKKDT